MLRLLQIFWLVLVFSPSAWTQIATVAFTLDFPTSQPEHYSIRVRSDGSSHYESSGRLSPDSDETDSFDLDFRVSDETRQKIFGLAAKADYFQKDVDSHRKGLASTGEKVLSYRDDQRSGKSTYNYSANPAVQALTSLLQSLSSTLEFGHRLQYDLRYQKLALEEELKRMDETTHSSGLPEIAAIESILNQIVADPSVVNVSRARAQRMLERARSH